ncbi:MAG: tetratricopeptide repeat protein [Pseudomonadota bacterium]
MKPLTLTITGALMLACAPSLVHGQQTNAVPGKEAAQCFEESEGYKRQTLTCSKIVRTQMIDGRPATKRELAMANTFRTNATARPRVIIRYTSDAIAHDPTYAPAYVERGVGYRMAEDYRASIADFDKAIELDPDLERAYLGKAQTLMDMKHHAEALQSLNAILQRKPETIQAYRMRSECFERLGDIENAIADQKRILEIMPRDPFAKAALTRLEKKR